jgi:hypothetical protein
MAFHLRNFPQHSVSKECAIWIGDCGFGIEDWEGMEHREKRRCEINGIHF